MGLDIGIIPTPIKYLGRPDPEVYDFVCYLNVNAEDGNWNVGSDGNTIVEYVRENMTRQMEEYIADKNLAQESNDEIRRWVEGLPWQDDRLMLNFSW